MNNNRDSKISAGYLNVKLNSKVSFFQACSNPVINENTVRNFAGLACKCLYGGNCFKITYKFNYGSQRDAKSKKKQPEKLYIKYNNHKVYKLNQY